MLYREWNIHRPDAAKSQALATGLGAGRLLCDVLLSRGVDTPEAAAGLLGEGEPLSDPFILPGMAEAVACIHEAIQNEEPMVIFGDYDVDGVTATALLYSSLVSLGAVVFYKLANRSDDGYGLSAGIVDEIADRGIDLIITVDNGISALEAAERAKARGVRLVITDHHLPPETLPEAVALVDPCCGEENPFRCFSGAGVAFLLASALEECSPGEMLEVFGDLAAVGTIADVMQLTGQNRTLVRAGLEALQATERPGLAALIEACGFGGREVTVETISYGLAPRLNAAGRMGDATDALRLLLAEDEEEAAQLAEHLQGQNAARQAAEQDIIASITAQIEADPALQRARVLVVWGEGWHQGIIGIVANRLVDRFAKPAVVIALEGDEGRGSGRSVHSLSLHGAIASCSDILIRYGGHDIAAGLSIERKYLEEFRARLNRWAEENCPVLALPELLVDAPVKLKDLTVDAVAELARLAPCGSGNPAPKFVLEDVVVDAIYPVSEGKHTRVRVRQASEANPAGDCLYAMLFGTGPTQFAYKVGDRIDLMVALSVYEGKAGPQVSARVLELRPTGLGNGHVGRCALFESFAAGGALDAEKRKALAPSREDAAVAYRAIKGGERVCYNDVRPLIATAGEDAAGRLLVSLAMLEELGLIRRNEKSCCYEAVEVSQKRDLFAADIYKRLEV